MGVLGSGFQDLLEQEEEPTATAPGKPGQDGLELVELVDDPADHWLIGPAVEPQWMTFS